MGDYLVASNFRRSPQFERRFPKDTKKYKNWITAREFIQLDDTRKVKILSKIETTQYEKDLECPDYISDIYKIRSKLLVLFAFPNSNNFKYLRQYEVKNKLDILSPQEEKLYNNFFISYAYFVNNEFEKAMSVFSRADKEFGIYRHENWLKKL